jgi:AmmeMemoRadiSam system protein B/AmmeMemoRadiSam system protein A
MKILKWSRLTSRIALALIFWLGLSAWVFAELRTAKVAGQFYPQEKAELLDLIRELLKRQPEPESASKPRILIVPHAGYQYSGVVAANGFRQVQGRTYRGVVVVGFMHGQPFEGSSVDTREAYETPLGELPVDQEALAILQSYPGIGHVEKAHESYEHSLEVELPFIQVALEHPQIVPVLMGSTDFEDAKRLASALASLARLGDYLFVFSTDFSHYHAYDEAEELDEGTINSILFETPGALSRLFAAGKVEACGRGPIVTSLLLAEKLGFLKRKLLYRANSGDTWGNPERVVGYAAIGMFEQPAQAIAPLSQEAGAALVRSARQSLERALAKRDLPLEPLIERYPELSQAHGLFVTLRKRGQLRGCIGRIQTREPLAKTIAVVALDAALRDSRFPPVSKEELSELQVEVSVLSTPTALSDINELVAGRDGVILEHAGRSGVFLPQVWEETGWTRLEFLRELASQKAGLSPDAWQQASLYTFQDQVFQEGVQ